MYYRDIFYQFTGNLIIVRSFVGRQSEIDFINIHDSVFGFMPQYVSFRNYKLSKPKIEQKLMPLKLTTHTNYNLGISY